MDKMLFVSMTGASQLMAAMAANTHNLANASTTGFRSDQVQFRSMPVFGPGHPTRVYAMAEQPGVDFKPGVVSTTGRELDVALDGPGWIAVQAPDGSEAYTRAGNLHLDALGILVTGAGYPVLGEGGPIAIPQAEKMEIGGDGTITALPVGQTENALAVVDRIKLVLPPNSQLHKGADGLMHGVDGEQFPADPGVGLVSGTLEGSNVNPIQAMVNMIEYGRQFELQVKLMKSVAESDAAAAELMKMA